MASASKEKRQSCDESVTPMTGVGWTASEQLLVQIAVDKQTHGRTLAICCYLGERARAGDRPLRRDPPSPVRDWTVGRPDKLQEHHVRDMSNIHVLMVLRIVAECTR